MDQEPLRVSGRRRAAYWVLLVVAVLLALFFAFLVLGAVLDAAGFASARDRNSVGGYVALAVVSVLLSAGCVVWAVHLEHRLREHQPAARSFDRPFQPADWGSSEPVAPGSGAAARRRGRRRRPGRYGPVSVAFYLLTYLGLVVGLIIGTVRMHGEAARSSYVQAHGIMVDGTVLSVHNTRHSSRGGDYYTSDVAVSLAPPVLGHSTTVVRYPAAYSGVGGPPVPVLVDPASPGYAEFPGSPDTTDSSWIITAVFAGVLLAPFGLLVGRFVKFVRHWAGLRRAPATG